MKHGLFLTSILTLVCLLAVPVRAQDFFTIEGAFDYETAELGVLWWPDPNGGVGVLALTDSSIPDETEDNVAVGPVVEFSLKGLYDTIWNTVLPGDWTPSDVIPGEPFGKLAVLWETSRDNDMLFVAGTGWKFIANGAVQPALWTEVHRWEGSAALESEVRVLAGVAVQLGPKQ